jgi:hypothetical protein
MQIEKRDPVATKPVWNLPVTASPKKLSENINPG